METEAAKFLLRFTPFWSNVERRTSNVEGRKSKVWATCLTFDL
jgi:hypothetical protein